VDPTITTITVIGLGAGLWLLARGMAGYRTSGRIADTSTSRISAIAVGEVRVTGVVEPAEVLLVSLLQSAPCVYYRAMVGDGDSDAGDRDVVEERSVGFRIRDASGSLRIFPSGARVDAPVRFEDRGGTMGGSPPGLSVRVGELFQAAEPDRATAEATLLRLRPVGAPALAGLGAGGSRRSYREDRLEPGDEVTVIGRALPFGDLADPDGADLGLDGTGSRPGDDPEIAADLEAARASGTLLTDPEDAWGNAAIPGFGIGRPIRPPELDPAANAIPVATDTDAEDAARRFDIAPETLVLAASSDVPLLIAYGTPGAAAQRQQGLFLQGLLGAVLAIAAAVAFAVMLRGGSL
jgi:hypothetical protein